MTPLSLLAGRTVGSFQQCYTQSSLLSYNSINTCYKIGISLLAMVDIILSNKCITNGLIRLRGCASWSAPLLFANPEDRFSRVDTQLWQHIQNKFYITIRKKDWPRKHNILHVINCSVHMTWHFYWYNLHFLLIWTKTWDIGTYSIGELPRWACTSTQSWHSLRYWHTQCRAVDGSGSRWILSLKIRILALLVSCACMFKM